MIIQTTKELKIVLDEDIRRLVPLPEPIESYKPRYRIYRPNGIVDYFHPINEEAIKELMARNCHTFILYTRAGFPKIVTTIAQ